MNRTLKRQRSVLGGFLLIAGLFLQPAQAAESDPVEDLKTSYEENLAEIERSAQQQEQSVMNQVAVRLDRIVLHYQSQGNA